MVHVNAILVAAVRQLCNSCATVQQLCNTSICTSVAQHLTCATPGPEQVLCMLNTSRALLNVEPGTLDTHDRGSESSRGRAEQRTRESAAELLCRAATPCTAFGALAQKVGWLIHQIKRQAGADRPEPTKASV